MADSLSVKRSIVNLIKIIKLENEYLGKAIDEFAKMRSEYQEALVRYFVEEIGHEGWKEYASDPMLYGEFIKAVLVFYSGRIEHAREPNRNQLCEMLKAFLESSHCLEVDDEKGKERLGELVGELG